jgi:hypothetical protein
MCQSKNVRLFRIAAGMFAGGKHVVVKVGDYWLKGFGVSWLEIM